jgi:hypothetical protein
MSDIREEMVGALLQESTGFWVHVNRKGLLHKLKVLPKSRRYFIRPAVLATMLKISRELLKVKLGDDFDFIKSNTIPVAAKAIEDNVDILARILALAIENGGKEPGIGLESYLKKNLSSSEMFQLLSLIIQKIDIMGFMSSIIAIKGVSLINPEEKIASGEPSVD